MGKLFWLVVVVAVIVFLEWRDEPLAISEHALVDLFVGTEEMPPAGTDILLNRRQLRYCIFEGERLRTIGEELLDFTLEKRFDLALEDYNRRCSRYRYNIKERTPIRLKAMKKTDDIREDALERVSEWQNEVASDPQFAASYRALHTGIVKLDPGIPGDARLIQRRLTVLGFYDGKIDGLWGPDSESALREFKRDNDMGGSATWDTTTQRRLFLDD